MTPHWTRRVWAVNLLAFAALAAVAHAVKPADSGWKLVSPPQKSTVGSESATLILVGAESAKPPSLSLKGRPIALERLTLAAAGRPAGSQAVFLTDLKLTLGPNVITMDGQTLCEITRKETASSSQEPAVSLFRGHPPHSGKKACLDCHKRAGTVLAAARTPASCHVCHSEDDLPVVHRHVMDPFSRCQMCHTPHGGTRPKLLSDAREKLCVRCHEAGHYRP